jgi:hypothetical protein
MISRVKEHCTTTAASLVWETAPGARDACLPGICRFDHGAPVIIQGHKGIGSPRLVDGEPAADRPAPRVTRPAGGGIVIPTKRPAMKHGIFVFYRAIQVILGAVRE